MTDKKSLEELFQMRANEFQSTTREIISLMPGTLTAGEEFLELGENQDMEWQDAALTENEEYGPVILLAGVSTFKLGTKIETSQGTVEVTEQNQKALCRVFRIGIPIDMAQRDSSEEVLAFMIRKKAEAEAELEQAVAAMTGGAPQEVQQKQIQVQANLQGFDLNALTDEQRKALELYEFMRTK